MLDTFEIVTTSGVVVWSRKWASVKPSIINNFITDVFVEEKGVSGVLRAENSAASNPPYKTEHHTLRWTFVKELGIIFVVSLAEDHSPSLSSPSPSPSTSLPTGSQIANSYSIYFRLSTGHCFNCLISISSSTTSRLSLSNFMGIN